MTQAASPGRITGRCGVASLQRWVLLAVAVIGARSPASPPPAAPPPADPPATASSPAAPSPAAKAILPARAGNDRPPSPEAAIAAYRTVESWVRARTPPAPPAAPTPATRATPHLSPSDPPGASVLLRLDGELVGRGTALSLTRPAEPPLHAAALAAMEEADRRVVDRLGAAGNDLATGEAVRRLAAGRLAVSVELAGPLTPIDLATFSDTERRLAPGLDGLAVRWGGEGGPVAAIFPGTMLGANMTMPDALRAAVAKAAGEGGANLALLEPRELREKHGAAFFRFRVQRVVSTGEDGQTAFLYRAGRLIDLSEIDRAGLARSAERAVRFLVRTDPVSGDYYPWSDPALLTGSPAPALQEALVGLALRHAAASDTLAAVRPLIVARLDAQRERFEAGFADLPAELPDPVAAAALLLGTDDTATAASWRREPALPSARGWRLLDSALARSFSPDTGFAPSVRPGFRGLIALAFVHLAEADPTPARAETAAASVRRAFHDVPEGDLVGEMPWLGLAEVRLAGLRPGGNEDLPSAVALRRMRTLVWEHQLTDAQAGTDGADLLGGISFTRGGVAPPTWQTARPVAFLAWMLADPRLTEPAERSGELVHLLRSLRFLRQLQVDDASAWAVPDPARAEGGVRVSPWDGRTPAEATAMTLLALTETLHSLERAARK